MIWRVLISVPLLLASLLFGMAYYDRYWRWRDCFNDQGRCYDPVEGMVYLEQAGMIWSGLAVICLVAGLIILLPVFLRRPSSS